MKITYAALTFILLVAPKGAIPQRGDFEVTGKVLRSDGKPFARVLPVVFLDSTSSPFAIRDFANSSGEFKLKNLQKGTYNLIVTVPHAGEWRKTIEVGPSVADSKGRVVIDVLVEPNPSRDEEHLVSVAQLSIPSEAKKHYGKALDQLEKSDVESAVAYLQKAVQIAPQFIEAWNYLGTIAYKADRFEEAEKYFRKALEQAPDAYAPLVNLGGVLATLGRTKESIAINRLAVQMKPEDPLGHSQLGMCYFDLGLYDQAETQLKQAKSLDPCHFSLPQLLLAEIYEHRKNLSAAIEELESFLKLHPDSGYAQTVRNRLETLHSLQENKIPKP